MQIKKRCGQWDGKQCKAVSNLTACVMTVKQGNILKGPDKVVVYLCPKHFELDRDAMWRNPAKRVESDSRDGIGGY